MACAINRIQIVISEAKDDLDSRKSTATARFFAFPRRPSPLITAVTAKTTTIRHTATIMIMVVVLRPPLGLGGVASVDAVTGLALELDELIFVSSLPVFGAVVVSDGAGSRVGDASDVAFVAFGFVGRWVVAGGLQLQFSATGVVFGSSDEGGFVGGGIVVVASGAGVVVVGGGGGGDVVVGGGGAVETGCEDPHLS